MEYMARDIEPLEVLLPLDDTAKDRGLSWYIVHDPNDDIYSSHKHTNPIPQTKKEKRNRSKE